MNRNQLIKVLEEKRRALEKSISVADNNLLDEDILRLSKELDELIILYNKYIKMRLND